WVGWGSKFASYSRTTGALLAGPFTDSLENLNRVGGLYVETAFSGAVPNALIVGNGSADGTRDSLLAYQLLSSGSGNIKSMQEILGGSTKLYKPGPNACGG